MRRAGPGLIGIYPGGQGTLQFAHIVLGRLVYVMIAIGVYWYAITKPTLARAGDGSPGD